MNYLVYLHSIGFTHKSLGDIFKNNENYEEFYKNINLETLGNFIKKEKQISSILQEKSRINTKNIDKKLYDLNVNIITIKDKSYPKNLKEISNPPYFLYVRGILNGNDNFFSIVGSRKISAYTKKVGESVIPDLTKYFTIVSGGAGGCDSLAHKICIENKSKTIVVFGTGIDITYPVSNNNLFEEVLKNSGALISIFPIGTHGSIYTFPIRNEIVSGISSGVLVLEAGEKSGTLITANLALDQGKDLFAIPGDIFNVNHIGTNNLIKNSNAKLITSSNDILEEYNYKIINTKKEIIFENETQENIYNLLKYNLSLSIDELIEKTNYNYGLLSLNLSLMELNYLIKKDLFGKYTI
ncbi:MAG: DNA-processing protein DprA [Candidatus Gracilibacteria bacterium]|nr:DNA-processing protein DprA [Candidatus Gracilibacteria bacterium]